MNIVGISYGPPVADASGQHVRQVTTTQIDAPAVVASTSVTLSGGADTSGDGIPAATGFARTGIAAYNSVAN